MVSHRCLHLRLATVVIAAVGLSSCADDSALPTAIIEQIEPNLSLAVMDLGEPLGGGGDVSARLQVEVGLKLAGSLTPGTPINIIVTVKANLDTPSATVRLQLPEVEAAKLSEFGLEYRLPVRRRLPNAGEWTLGPLSAGDEVQRAVRVTIPVAGNYRIAAIAVSEATAGIVEDDGTLVAREHSVEWWMFLDEGGGAISRTFDRRRVPDGFKSGPGPLRRRRSLGQRVALSLLGRNAEKPKAQTAGFSLAPLVSKMIGDELVFRITYWDDQIQQFVPAAGIRTAGDHMEFDEKIGTFSSTTTGPDGLSYEGCPGIYEELIGTVQQESARARDVGAQDGFNVDFGECFFNDTTALNVSKGSHFMFNTLNQGIPIVTSALGVSRARIDFMHPPSATCPGGCYNPGADRIELTTFSALSAWTPIHEYGHALHEKSLGRLVPVGCANHEIWMPLSYGCAMNEGFADYVGDVGAPSSSHNFENAVASSPLVEGSVAALLHDLIDTPPDGNDKTDFTPSYVLGIFANCSTNFGKRTGVDHFVWCLENRIDAGVHNARFPGRPVPSSVSGGGGSSPDDVRSTWIQNVGGG